MKIIGLFCFIFTLVNSSTYGATLLLRGNVPAVYNFNWNGDTLKVSNNISNNYNKLKPRIIESSTKSGRLITIIHP